MVQRAIAVATNKAQAKKAKAEIDQQVVAWMIKESKGVKAALYHFRDTTGNFPGLTQGLVQGAWDRHRAQGDGGGGGLGASCGTNQGNRLLTPQEENELVDYMIVKNRRLDGIGMKEGEELILKLLKARHLVWQTTRGRRGLKLSKPATTAIAKGSTKIDDDVEGVVVYNLWSHGRAVAVPKGVHRDGSGRRLGWWCAPARAHGDGAVVGGDQKAGLRGVARVAAACVSACASAGQPAQHVSQHVSQLVLSARPRRSTRRGAAAAGRRGASRIGDPEFKRAGAATLRRARRVLARAVLARMMRLKEQKEAKGAEGGAERRDAE
eukprot:COSAG05_NODE_3938_length_1764_cov_3.989801_1_plen_322_part_10